MGKDFADMKTDSLYPDLERRIAESTAEPDPEEVQEESEEPKKRKERKTYPAEEAAYLRSIASTSGRKGVKMKRINMAFTDENYLYVRRMALLRGRSMTKMVNDIIAQFAKDHHDLVDLANEVEAELGFAEED